MRGIALGLPGGFMGRTFMGRTVKRSDFLPCRDPLHPQFLSAFQENPNKIIMLYFHW
jgi:hypothetical protein